MVLPPVDDGVSLTAAAAAFGFGRFGREGRVRKNSTFALRRCITRS